MKKGPLKWRISIWRASSVDDGTASVAGAPAEIGRRWARRTDVSDGERLRAGEQGAEITTRFLVQADSLTRALTARDIIRSDGVEFEVTGIKQSREFRDGIEITAAARTDAL